LLPFPLHCRLNLLQQTFSYYTKSETSFHLSFQCMKYILQKLLILISTKFCAINKSVMRETTFDEKMYVISAACNWVFISDWYAPTSNTLIKFQCRPLIPLCVTIHLAVLEIEQSGLTLFSPSHNQFTHFLQKMHKN